MQHIVETSYGLSIPSVNFIAQEKLQASPNRQQKTLGLPVSGYRLFPAESLMSSPLNLASTTHLSCWRGEESTLDHSRSNLRLNRSQKTRFDCPQITSNKASLLSAARNRPSSISILQPSQPELVAQKMVVAKLVEELGVHNTLAELLANDKKGADDHMSYAHPKLSVFSQTFDTAVQSLSPLAISKLSLDELMALATSSREQSLALQTTIATCTDEELQVLLPWLRACFQELIVSQFSNYVVQKALARDPCLFDMFKLYATTHFFTLATNQYSSRCVQLLVEQDRGFRLFVLHYFSANLCMVEQIAAVYLFLAAIRSSASNLADIHFLTYRIRSVCPELLSYRNAKRVLVAFSEVCPGHDLIHVVRCVQLNSKSLSRMFKEKLNISLVMALIARKQKDTMSMLGKLLLSRPARLFDIGGFRKSMWSLLSADDSRHAAELLMQCWSVQLCQGGLDRKSMQFLALLLFKSSRYHSPQSLLRVQRELRERQLISS